MDFALSKLVRKQNVFPAMDGEDRETVLREMVGRLSENGEVGAADVDPIMEGLMARERLGTTGIGRGLAIPHVRYDELSDLLVAVGRSDKGIDFASVDGSPVEVVFLIISPESKQDDYLAALRWVSVAARDEYHNKLLHGARSPEEFIELFQDIEESL